MRFKVIRAAIVREVKRAMASLTTRRGLQGSAPHQLRACLLPLLSLVVSAFGAASPPANESSPCANTMVASLHNTLLQHSHSPPSSRPTTHVAYFKTHKTGSTTLGSVVFRYSRRRGLSPIGGISEHVYSGWWSGVGSEVVPGQFSLRHMSLGGIPARGFARVHKFYDRYVSNMTLITVLREPKARLLSWYYFFVKPLPRSPTLGQWLASSHSTGRTLSAEFGVYHAAEASRFLLEFGDKFDFLCVTDRFDDSLIAMALQLGWSMGDVLYLPLLDSHTAAGHHRWDGKPIQPTPKVSSLPTKIVDMLAAKTAIDQPLWDYANARLDAAIKKLGGRFDAAKAEFQLLQRQLATLCGNCSDRTQEHNDFCRWYQLIDVEYEAEMSTDTKPQHVSELVKWWETG